jgi:hypothetical protein
VSVSPGFVQLQPGATQQFAATVTGTTNTAVNWTVTGGGSISTTGLYTAPATSGASAMITATSVADPTKMGQASAQVMPAAGYTITGTVAYSGTRTGRIYVLVTSQNGNSVAGTSLAAPGAFTIRGVHANGNLTVSAWRDAVGSAKYNLAGDPIGTAQVTVPQGTSALTVTMTDPAAATPPVPSQSPYVIGSGDGAAAIFYAESYDATTGQVAADHYRFYWSTTSNPGPSNKVAMKEVKADQNGFALIFDPTLASGTYYFSQSAVNKGTESSTVSFASPVSFTASATGSTISGTVTGFATTDPLILIAFEGTTYNFVATRIANPSASQAFSLTKAGAGTYTVYAWVDSNNNNDWDPTDIGNFNAPTGGITVNGSPTGTATANVTLQTGNALVRSISEHANYFGTVYYNVDFAIQSIQKQAVSVSVDSGPNIAGPIDLAMGGDAYHSGGVNIGGTVPTTGSNYSFTVLFSDGSTGTFTAAVSSVIAGLPTPTAPVGTGSTTPQFTWTAPNPAPTLTPYTYSLYLYDQNGGFSGYRTGMASTVTSAAYSTLQYQPQGGLTAGTVYYWYLYATDKDGNRSVSSAGFQAQ